MSNRGKKLDLFIGATLADDSKTTLSSKESECDTILEPSKHLLIFKKEKHRGKIVTLVGEFHLSEKQSKEILKSLKKKLGCGGILRDNWMEFQGEIHQRVRDELSKLHFRFKHKK